jgi:hypothetical protein
VSAVTSRPHTANAGAGSAGTAWRASRRSAWRVASRTA